jgi:hypothetical protein
MYTHLWVIYFSITSAADRFICNKHITYVGQLQTISKQNRMKENAQVMKKVLHIFEYYGFKEVYWDKQQCYT